MYIWGGTGTIESLCWNCCFILVFKIFLNRYIVWHIEYSNLWQWCHRLLLGIHIILIHVYVPHLLCQKVNAEFLWGVGIENIPVKLKQGVCNSWIAIVLTRPFDFRLDWKFKKVIPRSMSNSYNMIQAMYEELSHSQGNINLLTGYLCSYFY